MLRARLIYYLRKQLTWQPIAVPGSGGGTTGGAPSFPDNETGASEYQLLFAA